MTQCWAYGPQGRCDQDAGHDGRHTIITSWDDHECLVPNQSKPAISKTDTSAPPPAPPPPPKPAGEPKRCVGCGHHHKDECKCGCYSFIG